MWKSVQKQTMNSVVYTVAKQEGACFGFRLWRPEVIYHDICDFVPGHRPRIWKGSLTECKVSVLTEGTRYWLINMHMVDNHMIIPSPSNKRTVHQANRNRFVVFFVMSIAVVSTDLFTNQIQTEVLPGSCEFDFYPFELFCALFWEHASSFWYWQRVTY